MPSLQEYYFYFRSRGYFKKSFWKRIFSLKLLQRKQLTTRMVCLTKQLSRGSHLRGLPDKLVIALGFINFHLICFLLNEPLESKGVASSWSEHINQSPIGWRRMAFKEIYLKKIRSLRTIGKWRTFCCQILFALHPILPSGGGPWLESVLLTRLEQCQVTQIDDKLESGLHLLRIANPKRKKFGASKIASYFEFAISDLSDSFCEQSSGIRTLNRWSKQFQATRFS